MNLEVGKEVFLVKDGTNSGRWARQNKQPYDTYTATITKVGRKYFTVTTNEYHHEIKFEVDGLRQYSNYVPDYSLYENEETYKQAEQLRAMRSVISGFVNRHYNIEKLSDEDLLVVFNVVSKYVEE